MEFPVAISRRKVKRVRLQMSASGLHIIMPLRYRGDVAELLSKYEAWIVKQAQVIARASAAAQELPLVERTDQELLKIISRYVQEISVQLGVIPQDISFRLMKTRWGSCSSEFHITFNKKLRPLPEELIYYVVVHELVHIREMNHGALFWELVARFVPEYKKHKQQLKLYAMLLAK